MHPHQNVDRQTCNHADISTVEGEVTCTDILPHSGFALVKLPRHMCLCTCHLLPSAPAGEASTSFRLISCVLRGLISMASLPSSEAATPPPSTVHSSLYESSWDPLLLSETDARGSDEPPCRAYHQ